MIDAARIEFAADPRVKIVDGRMTTFFIIDDRAAVRFKKLSATGASANIATQMQLDLRDPQCTIPGILADLPRLEVGYVPNAVETDYEAVLVAYPIGDAVAWTIDVPGRLPVEAQVEPIATTMEVATKLRVVEAQERRTATGTEDE